MKINYKNKYLLSNQVIHIETQEQYNKFVNFCKKYLNVIWGEKVGDINIWYKYKEKTCIRFDTGVQMLSYQSYQYFREHFYEPITYNKFKE